MLDERDTVVEQVGAIERRETPRNDRSVQKIESLVSLGFETVRASARIAWWSTGVRPVSVVTGGYVDIAVSATKSPAIGKAADQ